MSKRVVIVVAFPNFYNEWLRQNFSMPFSGPPNIHKLELTAKPGYGGQAINDSILALRDTVKSLTDTGHNVVAIVFDHEYDRRFVFQVSEMRESIIEVHHRREFS